MKVLQIIPSFGMGGAEKIVLNYLKYCDFEDVEMKAISLFPPTGCQNDEDITENDLPVIYLDKKLGLDIRIVKRLKQEIRKYNPDIIHTHLHALKYVLLTGECAKRKVFHTIHSVPKNDTTGMDQKINKLCFKSGKVQAIALQETLAHMVNQFYDIDNTQIIPNGIPVKQFNIKDEKLREKIGIPQNAFLIGHIGSFKDAKNHTFLIDVFNRITKEKDDAYLMLVGDGEHRPMIENIIKEYGIEHKVKLLGNRGDISQLLHIMDVFFFPSTYEGFGLGVVEAQAAGVRCVMSDAVPIETVVTEQAVRLSLDEPMEVWCQAILEKNMDGKKHKDLSDYDIENVLRKLIELYKESIGG